MISEKARQYGFWFVDALTGSLVRNYYWNLKNKLEKIPEYSPELNMLLSHAVNTTEFYKSLNRYSDINDFPIIRKSLIKDNYNQFISSAFRGKPLHAMKTTGTGGERFTVLQNKEKRKRVLAELIYFNERCGFDLGERYIYYRSWFQDNQKNKLVQIAENMLPISCMSLSDDALRKFFVLLQKDKSIKMLKVFASTLSAIVDYSERNIFKPDIFSLKIIISGAERLDPLERRRAEKVFGCKVVSRYANQENGLFAQQDIDSDTYILNTAHYYFEFLNLDSNEPAAYGQPARLIVTDLYNWAMPLIRYDTGDIVIADVSEFNGLHKTILTDISGRTDEIIYDSHGNKISPHAPRLAFHQYDRMRQYQLIQDDLKHFTLRLEGVCGIYNDEDIRHSLQKIIGLDAEVKIEHMEKIPHTSSGKFKKVICNYSA